MQRSTALAIFAAALAVMLSTGIRSSFGFFQIPITTELNIGREPFSLASAISNLVYGLPIVGILADRFGSRKLLAGGGIVYVIGLLLLSRITTTTGLLISMGLLTGVALSATTYVVVLGAVGQMVPAERRSSVFGLITMAGSSGMFVVPPLVQLLISTFSWRTTFVIMSGVAVLIVLLAFGMPNAGDAEGERLQETVQDEPLAKVLRRAGKHSGYWLLFVGFFVCGFHVSFIGTHLPAFLSDNGLSPSIAAGVLSLIGVFNMVGSSVSGVLGDRHRKKYMLSAIYLARAIVIAIFIFLPITQLSALIFGGAMGVLWLATVPLTSGMVAHIFGTRYLSTLYGIIFLGHQIGGFLGVWLGGRLYDSVGSYNIVWYLAIAFGVFAFFVHLPITDKPIDQHRLALE